MQRLWRFCAEYVLGTRLEILIHAASHASAQFAARVARTEIERLNRLLNHRRNDTEISELLRIRRATVSTDLLSVLQLSETWRGISGGAFDGRMGALLRLWSTEATPDPLAIEEALATVRASTITLNPTRRWVVRAFAVEPSLEAVATGYIIDSALDAARRTQYRTLRESRSISAATSDARGNRRRVPAGASEFRTQPSGRRMRRWSMASSLTMRRSRPVGSAHVIAHKRAIAARRSLRSAGARFKTSSPPVS